MRLNIKSKMLLYILSAFFVIISISAGYSIYTFLKYSKKDLIHQADATTTQIANQFQLNLNYYMDLSRALTQVFLDYKTIPENLRRSVYLKIQQDYLKKNSDLLSVWSIWEPYSIDNLDSDYIGSPGCTIIGNFSPTYYRSDDDILLENNTGDTSEDDLFQGDYYTVPKSTGAETILEPYFYSYTGNAKDNIYQTNMIVPIIDNGNFMGVVGVDVALKDLQNIIKGFTPYKNSEITLLSNTGTIVANNFAKNVGDTIRIEIEDSVIDINAKINKGKQFNFISKSDTSKANVFHSITPINIGKSQTPWAIMLKVPTSNLFNKSKNLLYISIVLCLMAILLLAIIIYFIANSIVVPLKKTNNLLTALSKGKLSKEDTFKLPSNDEIGEMANSANTLFSGLSDASNFATEIGQNNLDASFNLLSENDVLGKSLLKMKDSLKNAEIERNKRKEEEEIQRWLTNGIAKFGEILRNHHEIKELSNIVLENLLDYVEAIQGSLFMLNTNNTEQKIYDLTAAIAYGRDKLIERSFEVGEGVVGRCAKEKKTIKLYNTPEDFVEITSGLNQNNPKNFLLVPLKINEDVFGVIELVAFQQFKNHHVEFVEIIGENIASTLNNLKVNSQTLDLLEQAQQQKEELSAQEEEMRQNMEEMQTTQEESYNREREIKNTISALNNIALVTEFDLSRKLVYISDDFLKKLGMTNSQLVNKEIDSLVFYRNIENEAYSFYENVINGIAEKRKSTIKFREKEFEVLEHFSPVYDEDGEVFKILNIGVILNNN